MRSVLDILFSCDLHFVQDQKFTAQYAAALDDILRAEKIVKAGLSDEHWTLVSNYLERIHELQALDYQIQFERGFLLGSQLMMGVLLKCHEIQ